MSEFTNPALFERVDEAEDEQFYESPRMVVHIDDGAIASVGEIYRDLLPAGGEILDLMSSWRSHIPPSVAPSKLVGLGLNAPEMKGNPALTEVVVHNVNRDPHLPFDSESFDGVVMTVSVQYLTKPIEVFREVGRILRPKAPFIVTFSNRMFPTKAVALWRAAPESERVEIVSRYFAESGVFENIKVIDRSGRPDANPIWGVAGYRAPIGAQRD